MANKTKSELIAKAIELDIELTGEETNAQLETLIDNADDATIADMQKQAAESKPEKKDVFTREEVMKMIEANNKKIKEEMKNPEDENPFEVKEFQNPIIRIPRLKNKFVVALKDLNDDEYSADTPIYSYNVPIKNSTTGRTEPQPFVTLVFHDGTEEENYPLLSLTDRAKPVKCEVVETKTKDISYVAGVVTEKEEAEGGYDLKDGRKVRAKVTQFKNEYVVREPKNGETFTVQEEIINLV